MFEGLSPPKRPKQSGLLEPPFGKRALHLLHTLLRLDPDHQHKTRQEQPVPGLKCSCSEQAEPSQPPAPIREGRPLHQLNEPACKQGRAGGSIHHCRKRLGDAATHGLSLGNCSPRVTQHWDLHLAQGINWKLPSPVISNKSQLLIQKTLRGSLINLSVKPKQHRYLPVRKEQV